MKKELKEKHINKKKRRALKNILLSMLKYKSMDLFEFLKKHGKEYFYYNNSLDDDAVYYVKILDLMFNLNVSITLTLQDKAGNVLDTITAKDSKSIADMLAKNIKKLVLKHYSNILVFFKEKELDKSYARHLNNKNTTSLDYNMIYAKELGYFVKVRATLYE